MADLNTLHTTWAPRILSILRIVTGFLFLAHGAQKLFGFPAPMGGPLPTLLIVAGVLEFFGGLLILVGLFTRPVAIILAGEMAVAYFMGHVMPGGNVIWPTVNKGEPAVLYCFIFLYLAFAGGGRWSVDSLVRRS